MTGSARNHVTAPSDFGPRRLNVDSVINRIRLRNSLNYCIDFNQIMLKTKYSSWIAHRVRSLLSTVALSIVGVNLGYLRSNECTVYHFSNGSLDDSSTFMRLMLPSVSVNDKNTG